MTSRLHERRAFLAAAGSFVLGGCSAPGPVVSPYSSGSGRPRMAVPAGACDSHIHILDPRFPATPGWRGEPVGEADVNAYRKVQARIGTRRVVVVTPSTYGTDNDATLDALRKFGESARGVVVLDSDAPRPDLAALHAAGVRGIRVNFVSPQTWGRTDARRLKDTARIAAEMNWHIQVYVQSGQLQELESTIAGLGVPVVIDHLGNVSPPSADDAGHLAVLRLLANGRTWLKLSGPYISSRTGAPEYQDVRQIAQRYVREAPDRLVWGSDWPHRGQATHMPDDANLLDQLLWWAPDSAARTRILVANPKNLYGFS